MAKGSASDVPNTRDTSFKRPKIRESCTHCSSQKIRCTKERPACARCVNKGLLCQYNISRRTGTRRHSVRATPEPETSISNAPTSGVPTDPVKIDGKQSPAMSDFALLDGLETFDSSLWHQPITTDIQDIDMQYFDFFDPGGYQAEPEPINSFDIDSTLLCGTSTAGYLPELDAEASTRPSSSSSPPSQRSDSGRATIHGGGGCISTALQIFSELHVSSSACPIAAGAAAHDIREFDHVLDSNRAALEKLSSILDCPPCCHDQEVLTALFLAVQKALSWYSAALDVAGDGEPTSPSSRVKSPPAFLGSYALGAQAQTLARAYVVMAQLQQHFQPLLAKLQRISSLSALGARSSSTTSLSSVSSLQSSTSGSAVIECQKRALQEALEDVVAKIEGIKRG